MADDAGTYLSSLGSELLAEMRRKSQMLLYQTDPQAWLRDILGVRVWSKQAEIIESFRENEFTIVKSGNGLGKTQVAGFAVSWFANVFETGGTSIMVSAPVRAQIDEMMFRYLREAYQMAERRAKKLVGEIMPRQPRWIADVGYKHDLVVPKRPADSNLLSSFQGVHNDHVAVVLDEAGGLAEDFYIGANAVTTNKHARVLAIGNPDKRNTAFHRRFTDLEAFADWNRITIAARDSPNFTGEMIYPDDLALDTKIKERLVQVKWAAMMRRSALPGVVAAKVDGEFPDQDDTTFFDQDVVNKAWDLDLSDEGPHPERRGKYRWLGVDLAYQGEDKCVAYLNDGGKIRMVDEWNRASGTEHMQSAQRVHDLAAKHNVSQVRVDKAGTGSGVFSNLITERRFADGQYELIGINGANRPPNPEEHLNARAWHYDSFRKAMARGEVDLDMKDDPLRKDMEAQSYKITLRGQIQMTSKDEMRKSGIHSPDHLDAAIYSFVDMSAIVNSPAGDYEPGDEFSEDPYAYFDDLAGMPM